MKDLLKIYVILFFILLSGCKVEEIVDPGEIYEAYTVVQAEVQAGENFPAVRFTKTLPLGVSYDIKNSELKNVTAYIRKNEVQVIPLIYDIDGLYRPKYSFTVAEGEIYELFAKTEGKFIYAKTIIPYKPEVISAEYNASDYYLDADVSTKSGEVYGALWIITTSPLEKAGDFFSITEDSYNSVTKIIVRTSSIPEKYRTQFYSNYRNIQVFAFDKSFRDYFYTKSLSQEINDPFIQGGGNVQWNVQGDKVIGMFIGITPGDIIKVN
jgi:hypothetical protein